MRQRLPFQWLLATRATVGTKMVLGFEIGARYTFTDDLDGSNPIKGLEDAGKSEIWQHK